jgi:DeoR family transcriptional regulator, fructose operon transcriptional repressor
MRGYVIMFQIERLQKIRQIIREQKSVDVLWLSNYLRVSEVTIRRDLEKLEKEGVLKRTYGGAVLDETNAPTDPQEMKETVEAEFIISEQNRALGELSASIVEDYDILFLDRCDSNMILAEKISPKKGIVVFTNSLDILTVMAKHKNNKVILTGGSMDYGKNIMSNFNSGVPFPDIMVNKAFLHIHAVDIDYGIAVNESEDAYLYGELKVKAQSIVAIMEKSVFNKIGLIRVDNISGINYVITEEGIPDKYKTCFYKNGVQLHQKFDL